MRKAVDFKALEPGVDQRIREAGFKASFMSDAKWRKCLLALDESVPDLMAVWKLVGSEPQAYSLPDPDYLGDRYLTGYWMRACYFKEIEWVEFPREIKKRGMEQIPAANLKQDILPVRGVLEAIGQFELEETDNGLKLYAYK